MASKVLHQTHFTRQVISLLDRTFDRSPVKNSVLDCAVSYYQEDRAVNAKISRLKKSADSQKELELFERQLRVERIKRHTDLLDICLEVIDLAESEDINECHRKSAQLLGIIALLSPTDGGRVAATNEINKPIYKAVLCLRLLDRLCIDNKIVDSYISPLLENIPPARYREFASIDPEGYSRFIHQVKVPLVMAAIIQDIGHFHPDARLILLGESGVLDPYRVLDKNNRKQLLQINYRETLNYLVSGIGQADYIGSSKEESDKFNKKEAAKLVFIKRLLKNSINPKLGSGNLLKVPQIYTSIILSTKEYYDYKLLPKVFQVLNRNADSGRCSQVMVDALYQITGMFPQGFGITYLPVDNEGNLEENYEYAIVNKLYPKDPLEPFCRIVTRKSAFISFGQNIVIENSKNLYFTETAKKAVSISKDRRNEILKLLASNYLERQKSGLLPQCWYPHEFFAIRSNQQLWNKSSK
jgi:hypothetical protein